MRHHCCQTARQVCTFLASASRLAAAFLDSPCPLWALFSAASASFFLAAAFCFLASFSACLAAWTQHRHLLKFEPCTSTCVCRLHGLCQPSLPSCRDPQLPQQNSARRPPPFGQARRPHRPSLSGKGSAITTYNNTYNCCSRWLKDAISCLSIDLPRVTASLCLALCKASGATLEATCCRAEMGQ